MDSFLSSIALPAIGAELYFSGTKAQFTVLIVKTVKPASIAGITENSVASVFAMYEHMFASSPDGTLRPKIQKRP
ncbi:MAG: hypothetical protein AAGU11_03965 [Syntrophobacteraceae bacterium]